MDPVVLLFDEPTSEWIRERIKEVMASCHDPHATARMT